MSGILCLLDFHSWQIVGGETHWMQERAGASEHIFRLYYRCSRCPDAAEERYWGRNMETGSIWPASHWSEL